MKVNSYELQWPSKNMLFIAFIVVLSKSEIDIKKLKEERKKNTWINNKIKKRRKIKKRNRDGMGKWWRKRKREERNKGWKRE